MRKNRSKPDAVLTCSSEILLKKSKKFAQKSKKLDSCYTKDTELGIASRAKKWSPVALFRNGLTFSRFFQIANVVSCTSRAKYVRSGR